MQLCYRGINYEYTSTRVSAIRKVSLPGKSISSIKDVRHVAIGKYRGVPIQFTAHAEVMISSRIPVVLKYRGITYNAFR